MTDFVETSVLTSSDGVSFDSIKRTKSKKDVDSEFDFYKDKPRTGVTLFEQLRQNKQTKDDEWKAKHNPFS